VRQPASKSHIRLLHGLVSLGRDHRSGPARASTQERMKKRARGRVRRQGEGALSGR
jgi:hypothetical protein